MELFAFGILAGFVAAILTVMFSNIIFKNFEDDDYDETEIDELLEGLYTMKVATGLCRKEKEIIDAAIDYIEKTKGN